MEPNIFEPPKSDCSNKNSESKKRPVLLSIYVIIVGGLALILFVSSLFIPFLTVNMEDIQGGLVVSVTSLLWFIGMVGVWKLHRWGIVLAVISSISHQVWLLLLERQNFEALIIPATLLVICYFNRNKFVMKRQQVANK